MKAYGSKPAEEGIPGPDNSDSCGDGGGGDIPPLGDLAYCGANLGSSGPKLQYLWGSPGNWGNLMRIYANGEIVYNCCCAKACTANEKR